VPMVQNLNVGKWKTINYLQDHWKDAMKNMLEYVIIYAIKPNVDKYIWIHLGSFSLLGILWVKNVKRKSF
jgi:hypothetical protein